MLFNSYGFMLAFLPAFLIVFCMIRHFGRGKAWQADTLKFWITFMSFIFYGLFGANNLLILFISILWNVNVINSLRVKKADSRGISRKTFMLVGVAVNILLLLFFKFKGMFFPLAISFYTFNQISFIVDYYEDSREFDILEYLSFVLFFPKVLQGPIMRYEDYRRELANSIEAKFDHEAMLRELFLISMGLFKKVILADTFGVAVDYGFTNIASLGRPEAILSAIFYSFQLYFDFSGYCDVATGVCMMMGFEMVLNFNSPYKAVNIIDFWKRWHITLTQFFTKYVYIPLGGNRKGAFRMYLNFMIVFLLSGLWHGSGITFIVWGAMHGVLYVMTRLIGTATSGKKAGAGVSESNRAPGIGTVIVNGIKVLFTFIYVTVAWVFFRAASVSEAIALFGKMLTGQNKGFYSTFSNAFMLDEIWYVLKMTPVAGLSFAWDVCLWLFLIVAVIIIFFMPNAIDMAKKCRINLFTTVFTFISLFWSIISFSGVSTFLYMNF